MKYLQDKQINRWIKEYSLIYNLEYTKELNKLVYSMLSDKYKATKEPITSSDVKEILKEESAERMMKRGLI